jgi:uncharacterized damage-inducible protein DinB
MSSDIGSACIAEAQRVLGINLKKMRHCLDQLSDEQVNWRPFEQQNSIANIILHLCGNVRQWIISGIGGEEDKRHRQAEFDDRASYTRAELLERLETTVREADAVLGRVEPERLLEVKKVQGFDETVMSAMWHVVAHFEGHAHEIVYITRFLVREKYRFMFVPQNKVKGSV